MHLITDLHIHSHYSRACSKNMNIASLYRWGKIKGIQIMGTGDFTHPAWFAELQAKLEPAESGLFRLKDTYAQPEDKLLPQTCKDNQIRFVLTVEISNIYSKYGKVRKIHNLVIVPSFEAAAEINKALDKIGNLRVDGRPTLGMDSQKLLELTLKVHPDTLFIPAHIWTPWFGMFGSKSGFDSLEEMFGDLAPEVKAIETGLSSDPFMNWRIDELANRTITSHSDAHSAAKLGREATLLDCELNYPDILQAIKTNDKRMIGTIEFFPQEGKYHWDGHRVCGAKFKPEETQKLKGICPVCHRPLTVGVEYRVEELAKKQPLNVILDRPTAGSGIQSGSPMSTASLRLEDDVFHTKSVEYIVPLTEILAEVVGTKSTATKKVISEYEKLLATFGNEFHILRNVPLQSIKNAGFIDLSIALENMRNGKVEIDPGFDGVYGKVKLLGDEKKIKTEQIGLGI